MKIAQLQGTPWHGIQLHKTCNDGSKYCVYNHNICSCSANKKYFHKRCVGKGNCDWFEPKTGTPKIYASKTYKINSEDTKEKRKEDTTMKKTENKTLSNKKHEKFMEIAEKRVDAIIIKIEALEKLSDKNRYEYSTEEIERIFSSIENSLNSVKRSLINKNITRFKF